MQISKQLVKAAGLHPRLKLFIKKEVNGKPSVTSTGIHKVKLIRDKEIKGKDPESGKPIDCVRYLVEENGELRTYDTRKFNKETGELSYLVQRFADYAENTWVLLEGKRRGIKNYVEVSDLTGEESEVDENHDDVLTEDEVDEKFNGM